MLIPLSILWTNLHGGFFIFLACLGLLVAGTVVEERLQGAGWTRSSRYSVLFVGCAAASVVNPYGIGLHVHVFEYLRADWIRDLVQEFQSPTFRTEGQLQFEALLLAGLVVVGFLLKQKRVTEALWLLFLAHSAFISVRHAPIYAAVAGPLIAVQLTGWWRAWTDGLKKSSLFHILRRVEEDLGPTFRRNSIWPAALVLALATVHAPIQWPRDFPSEGFPTAMVHRNAGLLQAGRLLTTDQWGDYIIYSFYPRQKVFIDGRSDFYGETLGNQYLHLLLGANDWQSIVREHGFELALLPANWPLASLLKLDPDWQVIEGDNRSILFRHQSRQAVEK